MTEPNNMPDEIWVTPCPDDHTNTTAWLYQRLPSDVKYTRSHPPTVTADEARVLLEKLDRVERKAGPPYLMAYDFINGTDGKPGCADLIRRCISHFIPEGE